MWTVDCSVNGRWVESHAENEKRAAPPHGWLAVLTTPRHVGNKKGSNSSDLWMLELGAFVMEESFLTQSPVFLASCFSKDSMRNAINSVQYHKLHSTN